MYGTLYTSSEYYDYNEHVVSADLDPNKQCIICWLPPRCNENVKCMKEFTFYISECECNALIHSGCLQKWIETNSSCPICRKKAYYILINYKGQFIILTKYALICFYFIYHLLKLASLFTTIYVSFYFFYVILFLDIDLNYTNNTTHFDDES